MTRENLYLSFVIRWQSYQFTFCWLFSIACCSAGRQMCLSRDSQPAGWKRTLPVWAWVVWLMRWHLGSEIRTKEYVYSAQVMVSTLLLAHSLHNMLKWSIFEHELNNSKDHEATVSVGLVVECSDWVSSCQFYVFSLRVPHTNLINDIKTCFNQLPSVLIYFQMYYYYIII